VNEHALPTVGAAWPGWLAGHGLDPAAFGVAYLFFLINAVLAAAVFVAARRLLVISPNVGTRDYGSFVSALLTALVVATVLDNELSPVPPVLPYAALPHLSVLLAMHLWIYYRQTPWLVALGGASAVGALVTLGAVALAGFPLGPAHGLSALLLAALLVMLWWRSVATRRSYANARSIYAASKEHAEQAAAAQAPWLGLPQWVALVGASLAVGVLNAVLRGSMITDVPAATVALESVTLLAITALVVAIPALSYWLARRSWMPGLTRFVWLVWLVVGFAFTYGNFLVSLDAV
jgi:hypothetical protein